MEGATVKGGDKVVDIEGYEVVIEVAVTEVGCGVGSTGGADASILEDVVMVGESIEEDGGEGVVRRVEVDVRGGG